MKNGRGARERIQRNKETEGAAKRCLQKKKKSILFVASAKKKSVLQVGLMHQSRSSTHKNISLCTLQEDIFNLD